MQALLLGLVGTVISVVATYWFQGMVVQAVRDIQDGEGAGHDHGAQDGVQAMRFHCGPSWLV